MYTLNCAQSGSSFLANLYVISMSSMVSLGIPSINELAVCMSSSLQSLNALIVCSLVIPLFILSKIRGDPDSTPNHIVLQPASFIGLSMSREIMSALVSQTHSISSPDFFISSHKAKVRFLLMVKLSPTK